MEAEKKLTPLEEKWEKNKLLEDSAPKKATLNDAYTEEGKVDNEGLADKILPYSSTNWLAYSYPSVSWRKNH